jgi:hypothetical protein
MRPRIERLHRRAARWQPKVAEHSMDRCRTGYAPANSLQLDPIIRARPYAHVQRRNTRFGDRFVAV